MYKEGHVSHLAMTDCDSYGNVSYHCSISLDRLRLHFNSATGMVGWEGGMTMHIDCNCRHIPLRIVVLHAVTIHIKTTSKRNKLNVSFPCPNRQNRRCSFPVSGNEATIVFWYVGKKRKVYESRDRSTTASMVLVGTSARVSRGTWSWSHSKHSIQSLAHRTRPGGMREAIKLILIN